MRRLSIAVLVVLAGALAFAPSVAAASGADRAAGHGARVPTCNTDCEAFEFAFDARSGPNGQHPSGWFTGNFEGYASFTAAVTCLNVHGSWATLVGRIATGTGAADPNTFTKSKKPLYFAVVVHGLGRPHGAFPAKDQISYIGWDTEKGWLNKSNVTLTDLCDDAFSAIGDSMFKLITGNISVRDAH